MPNTKQQYLDITKRGKQSEKIRTILDNKLIGQNHVIDNFEKMQIAWSTQMYDHNKPIRSVFLAGPTGCGKTHSVELFAEAITNQPAKDCVIRINCAEFQDNHEIGKLIGSPPGYTGHKETVPLLSQAMLDKSHKDGINVSFLLFDEIEKAGDHFFKLLLGILDKADLNLGDNRKVSFRKCFIFMTSNIGAIDYSKINYGFDLNLDKNSKQNVTDQYTMSEIRRKFSPEFINRVDDFLFFKPLERQSLEKILKLELDKIRQEMASNLGIDKYFTFRVSPKAEQFILDKGTDLKYGVRPLKRTLTRLILNPFSVLVDSQQVKGQDEVWIDYVGGDTLKFKLE